MVCKGKRLVLRADLRKCPQRYSWKTHVRVSSKGGVGISFRPYMGIVRVHITVSFENPHVQKTEIYYKLPSLNTICGEATGKTKFLHNGQAYRELVLTHCGMVKELFVENFPDKRPLITSTGVLLHRIARDYFPQSRVSWKVRT